MRLTVAVTATTGVVAAGAGAVVLARENPRTHKVGEVAAAADTAEVSAAEADATERFWTPKRLAGATPVDGDRAQPEVGARSVEAKGRPTAKKFGGVRTVGALFFTVGPDRHYCTASVINSHSRRLLLTAAHCIYTRQGYAKNIAFVPKFDRGKMPYGMWYPKALVVPNGWKKKRDPDLDFGFIALKQRKGRNIQNVVGAFSLSINKGSGRWVNVTGYPHKRAGAQDSPIWCRVKTKRQSKYQLRMDCNGFYGGTSGSPWILNYNPRTKSGSVNGVLGGHQEGGNVHSTSYSPYFDKDIHNLRSAADRRA